MTTSGEVLLRSLPVTAEFAECPPSPQPQLHVLAVDDSSADRKVIERLLRVSSCKVTAVESGTRALQFLGLDGETSSAGFDGLKVNLIMTDYSMPGMTGYELLKKIKESAALREIPVVIMSSEKVIARIDRCLEEGAEDFIVKPVKLSDVKRLKDYVMRVEGEDTRENKTDSHSKASIIGVRDEGQENRKTAATHKRKQLQDDGSVLSCSPQFPLSLLGCNSSSPLQPSSKPHHIPKQPRLCSSD